MDAVKVSGRRLGPIRELPQIGTSTAARLSVLVLVMLGLALRVAPLVREPLHQDEALYGFWGRLIHSGHDSWLATAAVDKPPLVPYLIAGSQALFGVNEFAVRLPGLAASLCSIALTYVLARRLYGERVTGLVAAAVMALTPYPVLFGATAFTDPILVGWWLAACYAALSGRWGWAGLTMGLAFSAKQQALVLAPLVVGLGLIGWQDGVVGKRRAAAGGRFVLGLAVVVAGVFAWDAFRVANRAVVGFWSQGVDSFGGLRLIWSPELTPRLQGWTRLGGYLLGWSWPGILLLVGLAVLLWLDFAGRCETRRASADVTLCAFALFYLFLHWLVAFPVWDRYLLPVVPVVGLFLGRMVRLPLAVKPGKARRARAAFMPFAAFSLLALVLLGSGLIAASGRVPVGGDHGAYDGLQEVVTYLRTLPVGTVVYDRWLSWHYDFYLFDAYLYRAGFPTPDWLAADAVTFYDGRPRYLVVPSWESSARVDRALAEVGLEMSPVLITQRRDGTASFKVYEITSVKRG